MTTRHPLVTALINTFNYGRYLPFALNSVLQQTYPNIEIIVVDDGSTDNTREVLEDYRGHVTAIHTANGGQGHAFNVGIPKASGELIMLLDADDVWLPTKVAQMVDFAAAHPEAGMLYHRFQNVDANGSVVSEGLPITLAEGDYRRRYRRSGGSWWSPVTSVLVFRPRCILPALPMPTYAHREGADTVLTDYSIMNHPVAAHPEVLTMRRLHGANLYASGRDDYTYRSREIIEADIRRVEWRMFSLRQIAERNGHKFDINVDRNEWRVTNQYWLGRASFLKALSVCMTCPEHSLRQRWRRFKWVNAMKKNYSARMNGVEGKPS